MIPISGEGLWGHICKFSGAMNIVVRTSVRSSINAKQMDVIIDCDVAVNFVLVEV